MGSSDYALTALGGSLEAQVRGLLDWSIAHAPEMDAARKRFDRTADDAD